MERSNGVSSSSISQKESIRGDRNATFPAYRRREHEKDGVAAGDELSIFEAQKYFNESIIDAQKVSSSNDNNNNNTGVNSNNRARSPPLANMEQLSRYSWASSLVHDEYSSINMARNNYKARSFHAAATPTASSEASWNSRTGLLSHPPGTVQISLRSPTHHDHKKSKGMAPLPSTSSSPRVRWFSFPRRCPCSGKKSVRIEEKMEVSSQPPAEISPSQYTAAAAPPPVAPRSISLSLRNQTPKLRSVVAARDDQHGIWDEEHRRPWEGQLTVTIPSAGNPHNRLFRPLPAAAEMKAQHTNAFSFPILKLNGRDTSWSSSSPMLKLQEPPATVKQQPALEPLATSTDEQLSTTTISIQKHTCTSTDHLSTGFTFPASPKSRVIISNDDDVGSDASSDLFEIESFSTSTQTTATANNYPPVSYQYNNYRRDSMEDDAPSFNDIRGLYRRRSSLDIEPMTPSSAEYCYEPSEASIDWSVTTAEGLDRRSTSSEADCHQDELEKMSRRRSSSAGSYGLLSCRWEKAVSVGPNPVRLVSISMHAAGASVGDEVSKHVGSRPPLPNKPRSYHLSIHSVPSFPS